MHSIVSSALNRVLPAGLFAALVVGLSGCAHQVHNVKVDAIQNPEVVIGYSYRIVERDAARAELDERHDEAVSVVKAALDARGMYEARDPGTAEVEVIIDYGIGPRRLKVHNYHEGMEPTVARAPLAIVHVQQRDGRIGYAAFPAEKLDVDGTYRGLPVMRGAHVFEKYLLIQARETPAAVGPLRKPQEAWQVQARVEDMSESLDGYLPVLAGAAANYLGSSTEKQQRLRLGEDAPVVAMARGRN